MKISESDCVAPSSRLTSVPEGGKWPVSGPICFTLRKKSLVLRQEDERASELVWILVLWRIRKSMHLPRIKS
jgi:hypothetical protein